MFKNKKFLDAEVDIENLPVATIDREGDLTWIGFSNDMEDQCVYCSEKQHDEFLARFRRKIGIFK
jgi:hypothetical protein